MPPTGDDREFRRPRRPKNPAGSTHTNPGAQADPTPRNLLGSAHRPGSRRDRPQQVRTDLYDDSLPVEGYRDFLAACLKNAAGASTDDAAMHLWFPNRNIRAVLEALDKSGWEYRDIIVWNKLNATYGDLGAQYKSRHESFFYAHKRGQSPRWHGASNECTVWDFAKPQKSELHPTMRPVEMYERALQNHTHTGDLVLELFGGSGTTMIAAERLGRRSVLMEIDPRYVDVIRQRYADFTGTDSGLKQAAGVAVQP